MDSENQAWQEAEALSNRMKGGRLKLQRGKKKRFPLWHFWPKRCEDLTEKGYDWHDAPLIFFAFCRRWDWMTTRSAFQAMFSVVLHCSTLKPHSWCYSQWLSGWTKMLIVSAFPHLHLPHPSHRLSQLMCHYHLHAATYFSIPMAASYQPRSGFHIQTGP